MPGDNHSTNITNGAEAIAAAISEHIFLLSKRFDCPKWDGIELSLQY